MAWIPDRYQELRRLVRGGRPEREVSEEIEYHIAMRTAENVATGMTPAQAGAEALRRFGDANRYRAEATVIDEGEVRQRRRAETWESLRREMRHAVRALARTPAFTSIAVITLALGIGAATAIFTMLEAVVLSPLPYPDSNRLVKIESPVPGLAPGDRWNLSPSGYFHYRDNNRTFDGIGVFAERMATVTGAGEAEEVRIAGVSASLLNTLQARAGVGRPITIADDTPGAPPVVVLGHDYWVNRFGSDPAIVGRTLTINSTSHEVIGVLAPGTNLPDSPVDIWTPLQLDPSAPPVNSHYLSGIARLTDGSTVESAQADLARLTAQFTELFPGAYSQGFIDEYQFTVSVESLRDDIVGDIARRLWILLAAVGLVLVIACANVANLFIVRVEARRREVALRSALGAERSHLAWHYLAEGLLLALIAGVCATGLAYLSLQLLLSTAPEGIPRITEVRIGWESVVLAFGLSLAAGIAFGLLPLWHSGDGDLTPLRDASRGLTASRRQHLVRGALVVGQVALAVVLLAAAGLMLQSYRQLSNVQPGFDASNLLTVSVLPSRASYPEYENVRGFHGELATRLAALQGVGSVGATNRLPLTGSGFCALVFAEDHARGSEVGAPCVASLVVAPGYFKTMRIPVEGESYTWNDNPEQGKVVVSQAFADRFWPGENAIGKGLKTNGWGEPYYRVAGVAADVRDEGLDHAPMEAVYYPMTPMEGTSLWGPPRAMTFVIRASGSDPAALTALVRQTLNKLDPDIPLGSVRTMDEVVSASTARVSFTMLLLATAAGMAIVLSAVGMYGVISYIVGQRRGEIGIRMALGARTSEVGRLVVWQSVRLAALGVVLGLMGALATTRVLQSFLFEVSATDPVTLALVSGALMAVAALASFAPARRAARVDPMEALRS